MSIGNDNQQYGEIPRQGAGRGDAHRRGVQFMAIKNDTNALLLGYQTMLGRVKSF